MFYYLSLNIFLLLLIIIINIASGLRIIEPECKKTPHYDLFPNVEMIKYVRCPVFIMHGKNQIIKKI